MKIAFLHMTLGLVERGAEIAIDLIANELAKKHDVLVMHAGKILKRHYKSFQVVPLNQAPIVAPKSLIEKALFRVSWDRNSRLVNWFTRNCIGHLMEWDPDVVVCVNGHHQVIMVNQHVPKAKTIVFGLAGIGYHDEANLKAKPDAFLAMSEKALEWAMDKGWYKTKKYYVPGPVNVESVRKAKKVDLNLKSPVILTVGALTDYKNIDKVVAAVAKTPFSLVVIGDGERRDKISRMVSELLGERGRWVPQVRHDQLYSYYQSADTFCLVSEDQEAFGLVYLEAMAAGLPIVASDDAIRMSIVGKHGIYVKPDDLVGLAMGIDQAVSKGRVDYVAQLKPFRIEAVGEKFERVCHEMVVTKN